MTRDLRHRMGDRRSIGIYISLYPGVKGGLDRPFAFQLGEGFGYTTTHAGVVEEERAVAVDALPIGAF